MIALVAALMLGQPAQAPRVVNELADGFYCSTPHYFAYETLLHASPEPHLLHIVSLDDPTGQDPETIKPLPANEARGLRCGAGSAELVPERPGAGETARLWGDGSWARTASQRRTLKTFPDQSRIDLEIDRVSSGGDRCLARVGARLVWKDGRGRERTSRPLFFRELSCRLAHLNGGPPRDDCAPQPGRALQVFTGTVRAGASISRRAGSFVFELRGGSDGWTILVRPPGEPRDLSALTLPLHGQNSRDIPIPGPGMTPSRLPDRHPFQFHPDVGRTISLEVRDDLSVLADAVRVEAYGRGLVEVLGYKSVAMPAGKPPSTWLNYRACLSWPR